MDHVTEEHNRRRRKKEILQSRSGKFSFSTRLPDDVHGVFAGSMCLVKYTTDPLLDIRESILEMLQYAQGVCDWNDVEELVYCYISLNSSEVHGLVGQAFLSLWSS
ncbi:hypothetical protein ACLB2K_075357 [Fragaria x ananassa]